MRRDPDPQVSPLVSFVSSLRRTHQWIERCRRGSIEAAREYQVRRNLVRADVRAIDSGRARLAVEVVRGIGKRQATRRLGMLAE